MSFPAVALRAGCSATASQIRMMRSYCMNYAYWNTINHSIYPSRAAYIPKERKMTEQKIYFQWQNEALVNTIYPLRLLNLRNSLEYFMEIDLWSQFKNKKVENLPSEVAAFHAKNSAVIKKAREDYKTLLEYFIGPKPDPAKPKVAAPDPVKLDPAKPADENWLKKIRTLHNSFNNYFDKLTDSFRQSYFITQQLETLDRDRKELDKQISLQIRRLDAMNEKHPNLPAEKNKLEALRNTQPIFETRREKLVALISAFGKLEKRKKEYAKKVGVATAKVNEINLKLNPLLVRQNLQEAKLRELQDELDRFNSAKPDADSLKKYFSTPVVTQIITDLFTKVNEYHAALASLRGEDVKLSSVKNFIGSLQLERTRFERRTGVDSTFKELTLQAYDYELERMKDFRFVLEYAGKPDEVKNREIKARQEAIAKILAPLTTMRKEAADFRKQIDERDDILQVTEEKYLSEYQPVTPTLKDLAQQKLDEYRDTLKDLDQYKLLALLGDRFKKEPARFPRWLQYMIVHFSGMRYSSAHGSWADPKDLYLNLRTGDIEKEVKEYDNDYIETQCNQKLAEYGATHSVVPAPDGKEIKPHPLSQTDDPEWKEKVDQHLKHMEMDNTYWRRTGLFNLLMDEENYELESMTDEDALAALESRRAMGKIPDWMWKEISAVTDLRLKEAKDANWDKLTPEEQQAKNSAESAKNREMINKWKQDNLVDWREEHESNVQNIVSRAVCNEVAEYILHLRGHSGPAGLASAADWYVNAGNAGRLVAESIKDRSYFVKPKAIDDYRSGAAILWLKYRNDPPPIWNVVKPFETTRGETLLPSGYLNGGRWSYKEQGLFRTRTFTNEKGITVRSAQYLFWVHIATVAEVAETADGMVVLTYETSLPYEDRRRACVGVFKRNDFNVMFDGGEDAYNGSFVGYMPQDKDGIPADLDLMLDWDRILLRE